VIGRELSRMTTASEGELSYAKRRIGLLRDLLVQLAQ
jgi:hypothetical protein